MMDGMMPQQPRFPWAMPLGAIMGGLASGRPAAGFGIASRIQDRRQQAQMDQLRLNLQLAEMQREQRQREGLTRAADALWNPIFNAMAPGVAEEMRQTTAPMMQFAPEMMIQPALTRLGMGEPSEPTQRMQFLQEFLALPPPIQAAARKAGIVGAPETIIQMGAKLPAGHEWIDPSDPSKGVKPIKGMRPSQDAIRYSAIGLENERLIDDLMSQLYTPEGELNAEKFAQLYVPGSTVRNLVGSISQNQTYLKSGAAAAEAEAKRIASGIQPSLMQFFKGEAEATRKQLKRSRRLASMFTLDEMREQQEEAETLTRPSTAAERETLLQQQFPGAVPVR